SRGLVHCALAGTGRLRDVPSPGGGNGRHRSGAVHRLCVRAGRGQAGDGALRHSRYSIVLGERSEDVATVLTDGNATSVIARSEATKQSPATTRSLRSARDDRSNGR